MKIHLTFSGIEACSETAEEHAALRALFQLLQNAELVEGAGIPRQQISESIVTDLEINPTTCIAVEKLTN